MSTPASAPYDALVGLIEHELQLAGESRYEELVAASAARAELTASMPATPPECAREPLQRASLMQQRLTIELLRGHEALLRALAEIERGRRTARGYAPPRRTSTRVSASA